MCSVGKICIWEHWHRKPWSVGKIAFGRTDTENQARWWCVYISVCKWYMFVCICDQSYKSTQISTYQQPTNNQPNQLKSTDLQANNLQIPMTGFLEKLTSDKLKAITSTDQTRERNFLQLLCNENCQCKFLSTESKHSQESKLES